MTITDLGRRIDFAARHVDWRRVTIATLLSPLCLIGWIIGTTVRLIVVLGTYLYAAGKVGFDQGRGRIE